MEDEYGRKGEVGKVQLFTLHSLKDPDSEKLENGMPTVLIIEDEDLDRKNASFYSAFCRSISGQDCKKWRKKGIGSPEHSSLI